jgi:NitT/TauT family transport system substrate-binding protein
MTIEDIEMKSVPNAIDGANMFKQGQVDAAVVWSPDDVDCVKKVSGAKVLASTDEATNIIADCLFAKEEYVKNSQEKLQKLYDAWMVGSAELNADKNGARKIAAKILADKFQMSESDALATMDNVRYTTHGDNKNFFGLGDANCVTGDFLYSSMAGEYIKLGNVENPLAWRDVYDATFVINCTLNGNEHLAEAIKKFAEATEEQVNKKAYSTKKVIINFPTNSSILTKEAKAIINKQFVEIARINAGARIRIEGNTDNTGSTELNRALSLQRAQAVADYLINEFGFDRNRFIVKGNGSQHAIDAGSYGADEQYRSTEFQLIKE